MDSGPLSLTLPDEQQFGPSNWKENANEFLFGKIKPQSRNLVNKNSTFGKPTYKDKEDATACKLLKANVTLQ